MRHRIAATALVGFFVIGAISNATAADTEPFTWTGFYGGVDLGQGNGTAKSEGSAILPGAWNPSFSNSLPGTFSGTTDLDGLVYGVHGGYNFELKEQRIVAGVEADFMGTNQDGSRSSSLTVGSNRLPFTSKSQMDWNASLRLRLGFVPTERWLVYGTYGAAWAKLKYSSNLDFRASDGGISQHSLDLSSTKSGSVYGAGFEYAYSDNLLLKAEYLQYSFKDLGGTTLNPEYAPGTIQRTQQSVDFKNEVWRVGLSYKF